MNFIKRHIVRSVVLLLFTLPFNAVASLPEGISVSISETQSSFAANEDVMLRVTYTNGTDQAIKVLSWDTVLGGRIDSDFLSVSFDGVDLAYDGRIYKRPAPTSADYIVIEARSKVSGIVDMSTAYSIYFRGGYLVEVKPEFVGGRLFKGGSSVRFRLTEDRLLSYRRTPIIDSCTAGQSAEINGALGSAESIARRARDDMRNTPRNKRPQAQRYIEWFGGYNEGRWNTVQDHFNRIYSAVSGRQITFICDNTTSSFAYVYSNRPYDIFLGQAFWRAPRTGTDSKAGTIVHELSHFDVLGGTDDHVYGQSGARSLARTNPNAAASNADSHEYFAENTPGLPMPRPDPIEPEPEPEPEPQPEPEPEPEPAVMMDAIIRLLLLED